MLGYETMKMLLFGIIFVSKTCSLKGAQPRQVGAEKVQLFATWIFWVNCPEAISGGTCCCCCGTMHAQNFGEHSVEIFSAPMPFFGAVFVLLSVMSSPPAPSNVLPQC